MLKLIQVEFLKLRRRKFIWLMLLAALFMPLAAVFYFASVKGTGVEPIEFYKWTAFSYTPWIILPVVLGANVLSGVWLNLSFWYKLIDKTLWGALFSFVGCAVLIAMNVLLVPKFGYMACAWAGVAGYGVAMVMSYIVGQKKNPIDYDLKSILSYVAVAAVLYFVAEYLKVGNTMLQLVVNTAMLCVFAMMIVKKEHLNIGAMLRRGRK